MSCNLNLNQISNEKFNGIALFSDESSTATTLGISDADMKTMKNTSIQSGNKAKYNKWSYELIAHPSGVSGDGSISLNVVNLEFLTALEDTTGVGGSTTSSTTAVEVNLFANLAGFKNDAAERAAAANINDTDSTADNDTDAHQGHFRCLNKRVYRSNSKDSRRPCRKWCRAAKSYDFFNLHSQNLVNLEAARGRIVDTDVALESTRFAKHNVLVQASASMTAQANQLTNVALTLLQ